MKVNLQSVHFSVDYKLREYLEQKISKLEQFFSKIIDVQVFLKLENAGQVRDKIVEIKLNLPGKSILIKEIAQTFEAGIDLATEALKDIISNTRPRFITADIIKEHVGEYFNIKIEDFNAKKRTRSIVYPRQIAMYLCREMTDLSLPKIGEEFGRDHTTIMHAHEKISSDLDIDPQLKNIISELKNQIQTK